MSENENHFIIRGHLPSLNDYINACRSHWRQGALLKQQTDESICWQIKAAKNRGHVHPVKGPVHVSFEWHESDKRRDLDNVFSAKKYILDAMQQAGIIENDDRKHVVGLSDSIVDDIQDYVIVSIEAAQ